MSEDRAAGGDGDRSGGTSPRPDGAAPVGPDRTASPTSGAPGVAAGVRSNGPVARVAIVVHSYVEEDPRIRRETEALLAAGFEVDVYALRRPGDSPVGAIGEARIIRVPVSRHQGAGLGTYLLEYGAFLVRGGWALARAHRRRRYAVVQVATPPDPLVLAALPLRLTGVPIIVDLHEATPEFFRSRFPGAANRLTDALLRIAERASVFLADAALSVNRARHERLVRLGFPVRKLRVVSNGPSLGRFRPDEYPERRFMADGRLRLVYAGAVTPLYELDVVLRALAIVVRDRPDLDPWFDVYGRGDAEPALRALADELRLGPRLALHGRIPLEDVPAVLAAADVGVSPIRRNPFTEISMPTKALEYAAMRRAVIAADLPAAREHFEGPAIGWYRSGDPESLAAAVVRLADDPAAREHGVRAAAERARELSWDREAPRYVALVGALARRESLPVDPDG